MHMRAEIVSGTANCADFPIMPLLPFHKLLIFHDIIYIAEIFAGSNAMSGPINKGDAGNFFHKVIHIPAARPAGGARHA